MTDEPLREAGDVRKIGSDATVWVVISHVARGRTHFWISGEELSCPTDSFENGVALAGPSPTQRAAMPAASAEAFKPGMTPQTLNDAELIERLDKVGWIVAMNETNREVIQAASSRLRSLGEEVERLRAFKKAAIKTVADYARQAGEATGKLEMSEAAGIVEGWKDKCEDLQSRLAEATRILEGVLDHTMSIEEAQKGCTGLTLDSRDYQAIEAFLNRQEAARSFITSPVVEERGEG
jgi:hypothetical protein